MRRAIALAQQGRGYTNPNPVVGAVIVKNGRVIGEGYHERHGGLHAERNALAACTEDPEGAELYVSLEPCCHHGKTPPCTDAIIERKLGHVYVGSSDPNPLVAGKGVKLLRQAGIGVAEHVLEEECDELNRVFFHYIQTGRPYVTLKYAMTADGKIATFTGESQWITGEEARRHVHQLRHENAAIMVGIGTVLADDPMLNCRIEGGKDPVRIICDSRLKIPLDSKIVTTAQDIATVVVTCCGPEDAANKIAALETAGCRILRVNAKSNMVDMNKVLEWIGAQHLDSLLVEGGGQLAWSAVQDGLVDRVVAYIAPKIFGGKDARTPVGGSGFEHPAEAAQMKIRRIQQIGADLMTEFEVIR